MPYGYAGAGRESSTSAVCSRELRSRGQFLTGLSTDVEKTKKAAHLLFKGDEEDGRMIFIE